MKSSHGLSPSATTRGVPTIRRPARPITSSVLSAVSLLPSIATPFGLVLHELATNAARHGSLSVPAGVVELTWVVGLKSSERILTVTWRETRGPPVQRPSFGGLGSALIEGAIPEATVKRDFAPDGLVCTIEVPLMLAAENGS